MAKIYDKFGKPLGYSNATGLPSHQSKGLGDTVEKFFSFVGIKKLVKWINGDRDCGCGPRKEYLNKLFPYGRQNKKLN